MGFLQTRYGDPLAVPLFIILAQNRNLSIVGVDRGVGSFIRQSAEARIRIVSGRYDHTTKLMIQVTTVCLPVSLGTTLDAMQIFRAKLYVVTLQLVGVLYMVLT